MSKLLVIRHAQASFMSDNYDQLSSLGEHQSMALGQYMLDKNLKLDRVYVGPLHRHYQTANFVKDIYLKAGRDWDMIEAPAFVEHTVPQITRHIITQSPHYTNLEDIENPIERKEYYFRAFDKTFRKWVREELDLSDTPFGKWIDFKSKIINGLQEILANTPRNTTIALFTSGGTASVITGHALGIDDDKMIDLSWQIENTAVSEFLFSSNRITLRKFNDTAHIQEPEWITLV